MDAVSLVPSEFSRPFGYCLSYTCEDRRMAQCDRPDVALPEYRRALREMFHRPPDDLTDAEPRRLGPQLLLRPNIGPASGGLS